MRSLPSSAQRGVTHDEKVLALLSDGKPHTHHEIYALGVVGHSRIASLRAKGYTIPQWRDGDDYLYQLGSLKAPSVPQRAEEPNLAAVAETDGALSGPACQSVGDTAAGVAQLSLPVAA